MSVPGQTPRWRVANENDIWEKSESSIWVSWVFPELEEERVGSAELAVVAGFVAMLEVEDAGIIGQVFEDHVGSGGGRLLRGIEPRHFQVEGRLSAHPRYAFASSGR